jgi:indole-3-glycerol phosphate synthase/phosphoribosylanthranilate isomerase
VGVFRDAPTPYILAATNDLGLGAVQLHGREDADAIARIKAGFAGEVWTACSPAGKDRGGDRPVFDNGAGGTGEAFDWSLLEHQPRRASAFLAGGIGPDNARAALGTGVYGIDVGSRLESVPGRKDPLKVAALFAMLRPADRRAA